MKKILLLLALCAAATSLLRATPQTLEVNASSVTLGQSVTFTGHASDPDASLDWMHFYVNGPGMPGWNYVGSSQVSGNDATGSINWTPSEAGGYAVHIRAQNVHGEFDWNGNVATTFSVNAPNQAPQTNWASGNETIAGQATTLSGNASDPDGNLAWIHFYVTGPGMSGWNYVGSASVSGGDATASIGWTPTQEGVYAVHIRAQDGWDWHDWNGNVAANFSVSTANLAPQTNWASGVDTTAGQATTLTGNASDPDGNLRWIHFYVMGPGMPGWNYAGSAPVSGGNATGSINWTPTQEGIFTVHIRAQDTWDWYDGNGNITAAFSITAANQAPKTESLTAASVTLGQSATLTGFATDPNGNLDWIHFYASGPDLPAWSYLGSTRVTGSGASGTLNWTPSQTGSYTIHIRSQDTWGWYDWNGSVTTAFNVVAAVDSTPPTAPTGLTATFVAASSFTFSWLQSSDNVGVAAYEITRNGISLGEFAVTQLQLSGLAENSSHVMAVRARDTAGNWSGGSSLQVNTSTIVSPSGNQTAWLDINGDGIPDEVIGAQSSRFSYYISAWTTTQPLYESHQVNSFWVAMGARWPNGDQNPNFSSVWSAGWYLSPSITQTYFDLNFNLITEPGQDYRLFMDSTTSLDTNPATWVPVPNITGILSFLDGGFRRVISPAINADFVYGKRFFFVRHGKPLGGVQIGLPNGGALDLRDDSISLGGGASLRIGNGGIGTITLPGGAGVRIAINGQITITGIPGTTGVGAGGSIALPGGIVVTGTAQGASITLPGGTVLNVGADGSGSIVFSNGMGVSVTSTGKIALRLPPNTPPLLAQAVDILGKVLQPGAGAVWSVREIIDLANDVFGTSFPLPSSGLLGAVDLGISGHGIYQIGVKVGDGPVRWITVENPSSPPPVTAVSRDKFLAGSITVPAGADQLEVEFVNTTSGESLGRYGSLLGGGATKIYNTVPEILSDADIDDGLQSASQRVWFVKDPSNPRKLSFYTCFNAVGTVEIRLWKNSERIGGTTHQLVAAADFAGWISYVDNWVRGIGFTFPGSGPSIALATSSGGGIQSLTRACLIPIFNVIAQVEGMEAFAVGVFDGAKQGLNDDWETAKLIRDLVLISSDWAASVVEVEIMDWRDNPVRRAGEFMSMATRVCEEFVFASLAPVVQVGQELSTWEGFRKRSWPTWDQIRGGVDKVWTVTRPHAQALVNGFTSWMDDFSARMMVGSEKTAFQSTPWFVDDLTRDMIGFGRLLAYSAGQYVGYLGEQIALGFVTGGTTKIAQVLVKGGPVLFGSLIKKTAFGFAIRMGLLKKSLKTAALSEEMRMAIEIGLRKAVQTPLNAQNRTSVVEIIESALARGDFDRTAFNLQQFFEKLGQPGTNLQRMVRVAGREEQVWKKLANYFEATGSNVTADSTKGWVALYERSLRFSGDNFIEDRADDFLGLFRRGDGAMAKSSLKKTLEEYFARVSVEGSGAKLWVHELDSVQTKAYRYVTQADLDRIAANGGKLPPHPTREGVYVTLDGGHTSAAAAKNALQLPEAASAYVGRIEFDIAPVKNNLRVPRGLNDEAEFFEFMARDYPSLGQSGGGTQLLVDGAQPDVIFKPFGQF